MREPDIRKPCVYSQDYKRCPEVQRHFICTTALYRHCGTYINLARVDRDKARGIVTAVSSLQLPAGQSPKQVQQTCEELRQQSHFSGFKTIEEIAGE